MERFRNQIVDTFNNNEELVPEEVYKAAEAIGLLLKKKFACKVYGEVENAHTVLRIQTGIFVQKDFDELANDIRSKDVNVTFDVDEQTITVRSAILN